MKRKPKNQSPFPSSTRGVLSLVLHGHLPFVRHPEIERFLEEDWFYEALFETYLPLLEMLERLEAENIPAPLTLSLSPTLLSMMMDPLLQKRAAAHMDRLLGLAEKESLRVQFFPAFQPAVRMYQARFQKYRDLYVKKYRFNLVPVFRGLQKRGRLEIITTAATHGYLPIMDVVPPAVRAQIGTGLDFYRKVFGVSSKGFWLPECGYQPGHEAFLEEKGVGYFFADSHALFHATPEPKYGTFAPVLCPTGMAVFGRDMESSKQVWSSTEGYPGDYDYREFYRDVGYDLDEEYLRPYLQPDGSRQFTGLKYYRITGPGDHKEPYDPEAGRVKAEVHAADFLARKIKQAEFILPQMDRPPLMVCMYDAELFGHWWFEGIDFLEAFYRKAAAQDALRLLTPSEYLERYPKNQKVQPAASSWGDRGYAEYWLNRSNDWIYRHLIKAEERMVELAGRFKKAVGVRKRALNQAARELMLAQSSDWAFMMKTGSHASYAVKRTEDHLVNFNRLYDQLQGEGVESEALQALEERDNLFPGIDYRLYQPLVQKKNSRGFS